MKRVLAALSVLCLLITFLPTAALADTYEDLTYSVSEGKVTITDCADSAAGSLVIPATIAGYPVTTIGLGAFEDCVGLTDITIGENVTSIGVRAFAGCTALASVAVAEGNPVYYSAGNCVIETSSKTVIAGCKDSVIPTDGSVTAIGRLAFYNCDGLTAVAIPDSVESIGDSAFEDCAQLATVTIGNGVTAIGNSAFLGCTALAAVVIPDSVITVGVYAFSGCTGLTSVDIGDNVTAIGNSTFSGCTELADVTIGKGVVSIDVFAFNGCSKLDDVAIPDSVTTLGKFAFYNCAALKSVEIPKSVSTIGNNAFAGCGQLTLSIREENTYAMEYAENNGITYTKTGIGTMAVTTVTLRPGVTGVYFGGNLDWAESDSEILGYGFAVSLENPFPVADGGDASSLCTQGSKSLLVRDILETTNSPEDNSSYATMAIYARAYVQQADGEYVYSKAVEVNLKQVVIAVQKKWESLTDVQKDALKLMYETYADVMSSWDVPNLKAA